ncbi:MAG: sterol desaturase family protein [Proteobacteria bacterium]|nr:sterol desaturase family protein [Pseudomonadota bacterium]
MIHDLGGLFAVKLAAIGFVLLLLASERLAPAGAWRGGRARIGRNVAFWLGAAAISVAVAAPVSAWASGQSWPWRPSWWSGTPGLVLDIVLLDLWAYLWHRINHVVQPLWRFHQIHHRDEMLDVTSSGRNHPGELVIAALARAPLIALLAIPLPSILAYEAVALAAAGFHHTNLRMPARLERVLSWVVVTPSIHWMHHHALRADTDSNYAVVFSIWDRLMGSRSRNSRTADMPLGVEGAPERSLLALLAMPFRDQNRA